MRILVLFVSGLFSIVTLHAQTASAPRWAGPYIGISAGGLLGRSEATNTGTAQSGNPFVLLQIDYDDQRFASAPDGALLGGQIGYNWQLGDRLLVGIEADGQWSNAEVGPGSEFISERRSLPWVATGRARIGYAGDAWLLYATGGVATGQVDYLFIPLSFGHIPEPAADSVSRQRWGWTAGGGAEVILWAGLSAKLEYLFVDLGTESVTVAGSTPPSGWEYVNFSNTNSSSITEHLVRFGLNVRLGQ